MVTHEKVRIYIKVPNTRRYSLYFIGTQDLMPKPSGYLALIVDGSVGEDGVSAGRQCFCRELHVGC